MEAIREIRTALISVYHKDNLEDIVRILASHNVLIYSTGGTLDFIHSLGIKAISVEELTGYPAILGGRVKTLHPKVFGAILARRENENDLFQLSEYAIRNGLGGCYLYPFEQQWLGASELKLREN
jgi:phosphoribosylaminoimidazolecarboxamide formyltransferase/IMP cyclohydrolase